MATKRFFTDKNISYKDYLKTIQNMMVHGVYFGTKSSMEKGVETLSMIEDVKQQNTLIKCSMLVDKKYHIAGSHNGDSAKKIPIIMTLANIIGNYYDKIENLNTEELTLLGEFSNVIEPEYMQKHLELFADKRLLKSVIEKTSDQYEQSDILGVVEDKYFEFAIDKEDDSELKKFKIESMMAIKSSTKEEFLSMAKPISVLIQELHEKGISI